MAKIPKPFQQVAIERGTHQNLLLADACGLGKTLTCVETAYRVTQEARFTLPKPVLVVTLKIAAIPTWVATIKEQYPELNVAYLDRSTDLKAALADPRVWIVTYYETVRHKPILQQLQKQFWSVVVVDEAHKIRNRKSLQTKAIKSLAAYRKIAATATPTDRFPDEYWSILNWLDPIQYSSYWDWVANYVDIQQNWLGHPEFQGVRDPEGLAQELRRYMIRRTKQEVAPDLPPKIYEPVVLDMSPKQRRYYDRLDAEKDIILRSEDDLNNTVILNQMAKLIKLQRLASDPTMLGVDAPSVKLEWLYEFLEANKYERIIVFTRFRPTALKIAAKYNAPLFIGGQKHPVIDPEKVTLIVGTIESMGTAADMPYMDTEIFLERLPSSISMSQAEDRIHRMNITAPKLLIHVDARDTVDHLLAEAATKKWTDQELVYHYLKGKETF